MSQAKRKRMVSEMQDMNSISRYRSGIMTIYPCRKYKQTADYLEGQFKQYWKDWSAETEHLSSTSKIKNNKNYVALTKLGKPIIPLILKEISRGNNEVLWALLLSDIVGYNPVPDQFLGNFDLMHGYWLKWGEDRQFVV